MPRRKGKGSAASLDISAPEGFTHVASIGRDSVAKCVACPLRTCTHKNTTAVLTARALLSLLEKSIVAGERTVASHLQQGLLLTKKMCVRGACTPYCILCGAQ